MPHIFTRKILPYLAIMALSLCLLSSAQRPLQRMDLYGGGSYSSQQEIRLAAYIYNHPVAQLRLYEVAQPEQLLEYGGPRYFEESDKLELSLYKSYNVVDNARNWLRRLRDGYNSRSNTIVLRDLPTGVYIAQLGEGGFASAVLLNVTDIALAIKTDSASMLTYTGKDSNGMPVASTIYKVHEGELASFQSQEDGTRFINFAEGEANDPLMVANYEDAWAFSDSYWRSWAVDNVKIYVQTDRSTYRPEHMVYIKGIARARTNLQPLANQEVQLVVADADGNNILEETLTTDAYGSFDSELLIGKTPPLGSYSIRTTIEGETDYANFYVEEFQKPEYRVSVGSEENNLVQGDTATFTVDGAYLFGGPVAGAEVEWVIFKQPYYRYRYRSSYGFYEDGGYSSYYGGDVVARGTGRLDAEGHFELEYELPREGEDDEDADARGGDYQLTLQAGVTDEARRYIQGTGTVIAYQSAVVLNIATDRYAYKEGDEVSLDITSEDIEGNPISTDFTVEVQKRYWSYGEGRQKNTVETLEGTTDEEGHAQLTLTIDEQGSYYFEVVAEDSQGRQAREDDYAWVSGSSRWYWNYDELTIQPDKPEYKVGETARFVIQSPVEDAYVLITREGEEIYEYEVVQMDGSVMTYELELNEAMTPNGFISAVVMGDGEVYSGSTGFKVPPVDKFLTVEIGSDQESYEPRDSGEFSIRLVDGEGQGVQGQVALGLVDEGIFLIRPDGTPDIRGFFYALRSNVVGTELSSWYYLRGNITPLSLNADGSYCWDSDKDGRKDRDEDLNEDGKWDIGDCVKALQDARAAFNAGMVADGAAGPVGSAGPAGPAGAPYTEQQMDALNEIADKIEPMTEAVFGQGKGEFAGATVRSDFRDTILWLPYVETDADGYATVDVTFPDNLTEWRLTARAITLGDQVGQDSYAVTTTLPVIARLASPRFLVNGDETVLRVIGQSNLEETSNARLTLETEGLEVLEGANSEEMLEAGGKITNDYRVHAHQAGTALLTASALTASNSDAMQIPLPILPKAIRDDIGWADSGTATWQFTLPETVDMASLEGELYLTPSLAAAVSPALGYLAGYPYGCTEQTMSRFLPSVLAKQAGGLAKLPEDIAEDLDDMVAKGFKRLYNFQHSNGGWGFWRYDNFNPYITSYVLHGLLDAQAAGYQVRPYVLNRGLDALQRFAESDTPFSSYRSTNADARAYAYYILAKAGRDLSKAGSFMRGDNMSNYGYALTAMTFELVGDMRAANYYLDRLLKDISESEQVAYWDNDVPRYYWNDDNVMTTAYGLDALARIRPESPMIPKVVNWLLRERQGRRWRSSRDTAAVVRAALSLAEQTGEANTAFSAEVILNGISLDSYNLTGQGDSIQIDLQQLQAGENALEVSLSDSDANVYLSSSVAYYDEQEGRFEPENEHFRISRRYQLLEARETDDGIVYDRRALRRAREGDVVIVTVTIQPKDDYRYVIVNEPTPAGFRVIEEDTVFRIAGLTRPESRYYGWYYVYNGRDIRDERVDYYFTSLTNRVEFTYLMRAETAGDYTALPTQVWLMYEPDIRGNSIANEITVLAKD